MTPEIWARHSNPWSGWSRLSVLPLFAIAIWSRVWIGWWAILPGAAIMFWTWMNPRLFPPPASTDNWMSQGVLGEKIWLEQHKTNPALSHHRPVVRTLAAAGLLGAVLFLVGLILLNLTATVAGIVIAMLSKLWLLDRMVWVRRESTEGERPDTP